MLLVLKILDFLIVAYESLGKNQQLLMEVGHFVAQFGYRPSRPADTLPAR